MMTTARSWFSENQTLVYFLIAQAIAIGAAGVSIIAYSVRLETRVATLETRGSPHLSTIDNRLTVLESQTRSNKDSIERIVDVMTKRLNISP
jgi:uncharacterized coiled-coil protein SlyX